MTNNIYEKPFEELTAIELLEIFKEKPLILEILNACVNGSAEKKAAIMDLVQTAMKHPEKLHELDEQTRQETEEPKECKLVFEQPKTKSEPGVYKIVLPKDWEDYYEEMRKRNERKDYVLKNKVNEPEQDDPEQH